MALPPLGALGFVDDLSGMRRAGQVTARDLKRTGLNWALAHGINGWRIALERGETRLDPWCVKNLRRLAELEALAPDASVGQTLLHFDTRADNLLIAGDRVYVLDWPSARIGAAFVDWVAMAPSVAMQGGPDPVDFLKGSRPLSTDGFS